MSTIASANVSTPIRLIAVPGVHLPLALTPSTTNQAGSALYLILPQRGVPRLAAPRETRNPVSRKPYYVILASIRGLIPLYNLDTPCHCHKTFIHRPNGDIVERAAASRERFRRGDCRATARTSGNRT